VLPSAKPDSGGPRRGKGAAESSCALAIVNELVHPHAMRFETPGLVRRATREILSSERQQVAAVCFRILSTGVEFLLVNTRRSRWTFPKGGVEPGLTYAQSAAIEAYEEAGVHGRIEENAFAQYQNGKLRSGERQIIHAHLCEVLRLGEPEELNRNPTWFPPAKAKRRLAEGRTAENASELARVVDRAVARIRRFPGRNLVGNDPLMRVRFEAEEFQLQRSDRSSILQAVRHANDAPTKLTRAQNRGKILELRPVHRNRI
jgi:8-oxo-dGTP pyrophosphatase MutT (NUDIX family)